MTSGTHSPPLSSPFSSLGLCLTSELCIPGMMEGQEQDPRVLTRSVCKGSAQVGRPGLGGQRREGPPGPLYFPLHWKSLLPQIHPNLLTSLLGRGTLNEAQQSPCCLVEKLEDLLAAWMYFLQFCVPHIRQSSPRICQSSAGSSGAHGLLMVALAPPGC